MDFLFVCNTPPRRLLWFHHAVRSLLGIWSSELRVTFPMNVSCHVAIFSSMLSISKYFLLTVSFVMRQSFTQVILMHSMRRMLWCRNTSSFSMRDFRSAQLLHPHSSRLIGMAREIRYLLWLLTLASVKNLARAPIDEFPAARRVSIS